VRAGIENGAARQPRGPAFAARSPGLMLLNLAAARSTLILGIGPVTDGVQMAADESGRPAALL